MIHYSCDRCQRLIETDDEVRYVVRLEVEAKLGDNVFAEQDDDRDHLLEIHEILDRQEDELESLTEDEVYARKRYDLCSDCHAEFLRNPMGREVTKPVDFSQN
jgi:DNA-directed RNA polymerase subunit RPC12/RpoP